MNAEVSLLRLNLLRFIYLVNCLLVGVGVLVAFIQRQAPWDPIPGVAFSFLAALAVLSALGIRHPLPMLPLILLQLIYKTFWVLGVYVPLRAAGRSSDLFYGFLVVIALELIVVPWGYVFAEYVRRPAERWR